MRANWTNNEIKLLTELYPDCIRADDLCVTLNKTVDQIYRKAFYLKLKRNSNIGCVGLMEKGVNYRFKKGNEAWNKGVKGSIPNNKTSFKKNHTPWNTRYNGAERLSKDGYIYIRISKANWVLKHRLIYENTFGEIPEGFIVKFKDGNKQNLNVDNLYLCDRKQNALDNSIYRYPEEVVKSIKLLSKLTKTIRNNEKTN